MERIGRRLGIGVVLATVVLAIVALAGCGGVEGEDEYGAVIAPLVASPSSVTMPDAHVLQNQMTSALVILTNDKTLTETITGYTFNPTWSGAYSYSPAMAQIVPGASITTGVYFRPLTVGQQDTRLFIHHTLGSVVQPDLVINVKGKGVP